MRTPHLHAAASHALRTSNVAAVPDFVKPALSFDGALGSLCSEHEVDGIADASELVHQNRTEHAAALQSLRANNVVTVPDFMKLTLPHRWRPRTARQPTLSRCRR